MRTLQAPIGSNYGPATTAAEIVQGVDLTGKLALVTGGSAGLGLETTRQFVAAGATVLVPARSVDKARAALAGVPNVEIVRLDLTDFQSVESFAEHFVASGRALHIQVNSAGIMATPFARDVRGNEMQLSANHLGHFHLTRSLWPALRRAQGARVVNLSSRGHFFAEIDFDDPNFERRPYDPMIAYGQAKTACALFAVVTDARGQVDGIRAFSVHPGSILTGLSKHFPQDLIRQFGAIDDEGHPIIDPANDKKNVEQGASTQVWCAVSSELDGLGGVYCEDCDIAIPAPKDSSILRGVKPWASDPEFAARLWALSDELIG